MTRETVLGQRAAATTAQGGIGALHAPAALPNKGADASPGRNTDDLPNEGAHDLGSNIRFATPAARGLASATGSNYLPAALHRPIAGPIEQRASVPVIIVGGGIGGLAAALALQLRGIECIVYERDLEDAQRHGYGLTLGPTCETALNELGIGADVRADVKFQTHCSSDCHWVRQLDANMRSVDASTGLDFK